MDRLNNGATMYGKAGVDYAHRRGLLVLDPTRHNDNVAEFVDTVRHELLHLTHFMWFRYEKFVTEAMPENLVDFMRSHFEDACEEHVSQWERFLDTIGYSVEDIVDMLVSDGVISG